MDSVLPPGPKRPRWGRLGVSLAVVGLVAGTARPALSELPADPVSLPSVVSHTEPRWPSSETGLTEVVVVLEVTVDVEGGVRSAEVVEGVGEPFDGLAVDTVRTWRFAPARVGGEVRAARVRVPVHFVRKTVSASAPSVPVTPPVASPPVLPVQAPTASVPVEVSVVGRAVPRSAGAVTRERAVLEAAPHRTASDLLLTIPGTFVTQHSGEGKAHQIFFRGFDAMHGQDLEIWAGGAPVNQVSHVHGQGYADLHFLMPEVVERIDALPGVYSPAQGDFAIAGSMHYELGYEEPGITARGTLGSFGTHRVFLAAHPEGHPAANFAAFEGYESDGFGVGRASRRASGVAQWEHQLNQQTHLTASVASYAGRFGSAGVIRLDDLEAGRIGRFGSYDTQQGGYSGRTQLVVSLEGAEPEYRYQLAPYLVLTNQTLRHNYTGYLDDPVHGDALQQSNAATTVGFRAEFERNLRLISARDSVTFGLSGRHDVIEQAERHVHGTTPNVQETTIDARIRATNLSGYLDAKLHPIRRVLLRGGVRWDALGFLVEDRVREGGQRGAAGTHLGARATLDVVVLPGLHALASYGEGFRSPQARSLGDGERTPFTQVSATEAGLRYRERRIEAAAAVFYTRLSDDVLFFETLGRNERVPATERRGVVVDFSARPSPWLTSALGFTYTRATFREASSDYARGALVPFVPELVVRSDLMLRRPVMKLLRRELVGTLGFGATWVVKRPIPLGETGRDVQLLDGRASLRLKEVELGLETLNLLDREWNDGEFVYASNFTQNARPSLLPGRHVSAGAPRTVLGTLTLYL